MREVWPHIARFILLVLLQVLVFNQLLIAGWATPLLYPLFVILLPIRMPLGVQLLLAFAIGLAIDVFVHTGGLHALSAVFLAFVRPLLLNVLTPREGYQPDDKPTIQRLGLSWFLPYLAMAFLVHHLVYYFVAVLNWHHWPFILGRTLASWLLSIIIAMVMVYVAFPLRSKNR